MCSSAATLKGRGRASVCCTPCPLPTRPASRPHPAPQAALLNAVVIGGANVGGTLVSILLADRVGRRALLLQAGVQMAGALTGVAALVGSSLGGHPASALPKGTVWATLALVCVFVLGAHRGGGGGWGRTRGGRRQGSLQTWGGGSGAAGACRVTCRDSAPALLP